MRLSREDGDDMVGTNHAMLVPVVHTEAAGTEEAKLPDVKE
jgi:hypothetical protein